MSVIDRLQVDRGVFGGVFGLTDREDLTIGYERVVEELVDAIESVVTGGRYVSTSIADVMLLGMVSSQVQPSQSLTMRERQVLSLLADGKAMKQAALELKISTKTVETHRRAIMEKLQLFSVAELTKHAIREGYSSLI